MLSNKALSAAGGVATYIEDVFSTYLYNGTGSSQTITNGIDLAGKGGLLWTKRRDSTSEHGLFDSERGFSKELNSNNTSQQYTGGNITATSTGFSVTGGAGETNPSGGIIVSWTFRKQAKFFDVVTYTGNGSNRTIAHNLGSTPGCVIIKCTSQAYVWAVYHRGMTSAAYAMQLQATDTQSSEPTYFNSTAPTSTVFSVGTANATNANGETYVAYLFAHDAGGFGASGTDNVISCGSFTADGSGNATVTLGYEPQWLLVKRTSSGEDWWTFDSMRGLTVGSSGDALLRPNTSGAEANLGDIFSPTATGFTSTISGAPSESYIYIAIRRGPMKTPTDATKVFTPTVYTGTNANHRLIDTTIAPDMVWIRQRNSTTVAGMVVGDRLRAQPYILTGSTAAEVDDADSFDAQIVSTTEYGTAFSSMSGVWVGNDATSKLNASTTASNQIAEAFKRAPGFFDVVCYTGTGSTTTISHNLGVAPEMIFIKTRNEIASWAVYNKDIGNTKAMFLDLSDAAFIDSNYWNNTSPTSSVFTVSTDSYVNSSTRTYVAYLFATLSGVSKVGSYTGNGSSQTINCGFTNGARLVLIKRTDSTGDWYVFDSARGIVAGNDPYLLLNFTAAEVTTYDAVDTDSTGFIVNNDNTNYPVNVNTATYIFLAIA